jgi:ribosomal protein L37AE/L43A
MSLNSVDRSTHDGSPYELYEFTGQFRSYYYTNNSEEVTFDGKTFLPCAIERSVIEFVSLLGGIITTDVSVPISDVLAQDYCLRKTPNRLHLKIWECQRSISPDVEAKCIWRGRAISYATENDMGVIKTQSMAQTRLSKKTRVPFYQTTCNHVVYDNRCGLNREDFTHEATVTDVFNNIITVDDDGFSNAELVVGSAKVVRTGEEKLIVSNTNNVLTVSQAFTDIEVGDTITLTLGCPLSYDVCKARFNNIDNFGGFMFIPTTNPFES